jgi:hypothetical protein
MRTRSQYDLARPAIGRASFRPQGSVGSDSASGLFGPDPVDDSRFAQKLETLRKPAPTGVANNSTRSPRRMTTTRLERAAIKMHRFLHDNLGSTDD